MKLILVALALAAAPILAMLSRRITAAYCGTAPPYSLVASTGALATAVSVLVWPGLVGVTGSMALVWALLTLAAIDLRVLRLPDPLTLPMIVLGIAWSAWAERSVLEHMAGAIAGYGGLAGVAFLYRRARGRDGLGLGDAKLLAVAGAWLGWRALPHVLLVASLCALAGVAILMVRRGEISRTTRLAFGPALALSIWLSWVFEGWKGSSSSF